ncbi:MAG: sensor histidine kinase [Thermoleophilia bacterium]
MSIRNKIRFSIANRMSLVFFSVFILAVGIIYLYVVPQLENRLTEEKNTNLTNYATLFSESFVTAYNQGASPVYLDLLTQQYAEKADARILVINGSGALLADSLKGQAFDVADYPVANTAMINRAPVAQTAQLGGKNYGMAAVPLVSNNRIFGVIVVSSSMSDVESAVSLVQRQLSIAALVAMIIALVAIYLASRMLARRIQRIEKGAVLMAQGDFATRVTVTSKDELGQLAQAFNDMGDQLGLAFHQIDEEKRRAKLLLDDLSEGVIGIDGKGCVIVANPAAERLLGQAIAPPRPLSECVPGDVYALWDSMDQGSPVREDIFMVEDDRALQVHSAFLSDQEELNSLLVFRDVSQEVKLERSRRDFIANASHELKTPLFSLGGFLEILQDEEVEEETRKEFVTIMKEQVDRLAELARNLLDLSRMDSGAMAIDIDDVGLREVIDSVAREFSVQSVSQAASVDTSGLSEDVTALCDRDRTAQLVRILLDNALKYSPAGATVSVAGSGNGDSASFTVSDHGPGIPADELARVFERFYRGRGAGRVRGTGLGLSIARELTRLMHGSIEVKSSAVGTTFTVTLPRSGSQTPVNTT